MPLTPGEHINTDDPKKHECESLGMIGGVLFWKTLEGGKIIALKIVHGARYVVSQIYKAKEQ